MTTEIIKIGRYFKQLTAASNEFFLTNQNDTQANISNSSFGGYDQLFQFIEDTWAECIHYCKNVSPKQPRIKTILKTQFNIFCKQAFDSFYQNHQSGFKSVDSISLELDQLLLPNQTLTNTTSNSKFEEYKFAFYHLLCMYKSEVEEMAIVDLILPPNIDSNQTINGSKISRNQIMFSDHTVRHAVYDILKIYFVGREDDFKNLLFGKPLIDRLLFPHNQNKFVEVFKRLKCNNLIANTYTEIAHWLSSNFNYFYKKGKIEQIRPFNTTTALDIFTKGQGEPSFGNRICQVDWLPFQTHSSIQRKKRSQKLI